MNTPLDPEETHGGHEPEDPFDENSMTWGAADPDFDRLLRERVGPLPTMPTPPYAFERVLLAGRRRRARKVWAASGVAALVVMAGTAGTTVALRGPSSGVAVPAASSTGENSPSAGPSPTASASPRPSSPGSTPSGLPTIVATPTQTVPSSPSRSATPECQTDSFQLTVSVVPNSQAAGSELLNLTLTNTSPQDCTVYGYPGLGLVDQNGTAQSTPAVGRVDSADKKQITVPAGKSASSTVRFDFDVPAAGEPTTGDCELPSYYLDVIPPNQQTAIRGQIEGGPVTVCNHGALQETPLVPGSTGPNQ
jgi:hypothetical protein